ncbi:MAG: filamentous hemagglutinin N-terminal domain-containing protein [Pseudomonadota bacterium]|nr:filamentous hemagglutinin N-terminal domain-containing protein [Pseudomonadota bacterium]
MKNNHRACEAEATRKISNTRLAAGKKTVFRPHPTLSALLSALILTAASQACALDPNALPTGGSITAGSGAISQSGAYMRIDQASQNLVANWNSFNIGAAAHVNFSQPNAQAVALNRILGSDASQIFGRLTANGQVFLINPSGVLFGATARVDVGGLVAATLDISDADFLAGRRIFGNGGASGVVINLGEIRAADHGYVALLAPQVRNEGVIVARLGSVALAAGNKVTLDTAGDGLLKVVVDEAAVNALAENKGLIRADGGLVYLGAKSAGDVMATVVNNSGVVEAKGLIERDGKIMLVGGEAGVVANSGRLDVSSATGHGGTVEVLGDKVGLFDGTRIDASGTTGGGEVLIGGDFQGNNPEVQNATRTYVGQDVQIKADAGVDGDGGKVIVWADAATRYYGATFARGAGLGDGGFVEVSGKQNLTFAGTVDVGAANGRVGTVLLDPNDLYVGAIQAGATEDSANPFQALDGNDYYVLAASLAGNAAYTLQASRDVIFNADVNFGSSGGNSVSVTAASNIRSTGSSVTTAGGALTLNAATLSLGAINTNGGLLTINNSGAATQSGVITGIGGLTKTGSGTLTLNQANTHTGATTINAGTLALGGSDVLADATAVTVNGAAAILAMNAFNDTVASVTLQGGGSITGTGTLASTAAYDLQSGTVSAILGGTAGANKTTTGTTTLSGANTYTGTTTVSGGTLVAAHANALGTTAGATSVAANSTLTIQSVAVAENITISGGTLALAGTNPAVTPDVTFAAGSTLNYAGYTGTVSFNQQAQTATGLTSLAQANFDNIDTLVGNGTATTLTGVNSGQIFALTGVNAGTAGALPFTGVGNLTGGVGGDTFVYVGAFTLSGAIVDNGGVTTLTGTIRTTGNQTYNGAINTTNAASVVDIQANTLNIASSGVDIDLDTTVSTLNVVNSGATGNITIRETNGLTIAALKLTGLANTTGTVTLISGNGSIDLQDDSVVSQGGLVTLTATGGMISEADQGGYNSVPGIVNPNGAAVLTAGSGIGANNDGTGNESIDTTVARLTATTASGDIFINETDGIILTSANSGSGGGGIWIKAGGTIDLGTATATGGTVDLNTGGAITDGNGDATNVTATSLSATATSGIGGDIGIGGAIETTVGTLRTTNTTSGNTRIDNSGGLLTVVGMNPSSGPGAGSIALTNVGSIDIQGVFDSSPVNGPDGVSISANGATADITAATPHGIGSRPAAINSGNGNVAVTAGRDIVLGNTTGTRNGVTAGGSLTLTAGRDVTINPDSVVSGSGATLIDVGRNIELKSSATMASAAASITLDAVQDILINSGSSATQGGVVASAGHTVTMTAGRQVTVSRVQSIANTVAGTAGIVNISAGTSIDNTAGTSNSTANVTGTTINLIAGAGGIGLLNGALDVNAGVRLDADTRADGAAISIKDVSGGLPVGTIDARGPTTTGGVTLVATGGSITDATPTDDATINIYADSLSLTATSGSIGGANVGLVLADLDTTITTLILASATNGSITLTNTQAMSVTSATATGTGSNNISLATVGGDLTVGGAITAEDGTATLTAAGAILNGGGTVTAPTIDLNAATGIGIGAAGAIRLASSTTMALTADTTAGAITLSSDPTGTVTINSMATGNNGVIHYSQADSNLVVAGAITSQGGNITLDPPVDVDINAAITSGGGAILIEATDDIRVNAGGSIASGDGSITLTANQDNLATGNFTQAAASGAIDAGSGLVAISGVNAQIADVRTTGNAGITATGGAITEDGDVGVDLQAVTLTLRAATGIGAAGAGDIDTAVASLTATTTNGGIWISNSGGPLTVTSDDVIASNGPVTLLNTGNLTLALGSVVTGNDPGTAVVLSTGADLINNAGANAVVANGGGRWLIYSVNPANNTFAGLLSVNLALWNRTYALPLPAEAGNRYLFSVQPTLTFNALDQSKPYGTVIDYSAPVLNIHFSVTGLVNAATYGNVFSQDTYSGTPVMSSAGAAAVAGVAGSPYAINIAAGLVTDPAGYGTSVNPGTLAVTGSAAAPPELWAPLAECPPEHLSEAGPPPWWSHACQRYLPKSVANVAALIEIIGQGIKLPDGVSGD